MRRLILLSLVALAAARYVDNAREKRDVEAHDWLTDAQKSELKALKESADAASLKKRTMELYDLLPSEEKEKWNKKYKEMCVAWVKEVATEEETANYKKWKAEGKMDEITGQYKKLKERLSEEKRKDVELWEGECWSLWKDEFPAASRGRRAVMELAEEKLAFLGAEKIAELKALKESGASDDVIRDKVVTWTLEHWKSKNSSVSTGDFVKKCYGWIKDVTQAEEYEAFEKLHHTDHEACRVKVREFLARLPAEKQKEVEKSLPLCDAIWYKQHQEEHGAHAGHGDHDHHAHKHHVKRHLNTMHIDKFMTWLSPEQKAKIHELEEAGESYEALLHKMKEWYKELEADRKEEVRELLKGKCAEWVYSKTNEEEKAELHEFIRMADKEGLIEFLKKPYAKLSEEEKHEVDHTKEMCLHIWTTAPDRKRRDYSKHEEYKEYFSWLTDDQQAEVKALRDAGKHEEVYKKTMEYWDAAVGDKKTEATEKMKGACRHYFKGAFGEAAVEEVKALKESGASMDDIGKKVEEFISKITDEKKREVASKASDNCKKIFSASRKRRDEPDQYAAYKQYFTWLTPEQSAEIRALKEAKDEDGINDKIHEYFNALVGEKKVEASEKLKGACKHFFKDVFGEAATEELKALKESGSSIDAIADKVNELIGKITDEKKKAVAGRASANCKKYFSASRKRRHEHDPHEEYKEYFSWLTPEQGAEIKALRDAHKHDDAYAKTFDFLEALSGDKKTEATEKIKGACKHYFKKAFGDEAVEEVKALKESGASMDVIGQKVSDFIDKITDEKKKAVANRVSVNCKKIYSTSRKRRAEQDHHEEYKEYFSWLTPEQGAELKALRDADKHDDAYAKTLDFLEALSGDKKTEATEKLKGACKHYFKKAFGDEAVEEVKALKESGASMDVIGQKVSDFIDKITDEKKKAVANRVSVNCKKVFSASRKRRHEHDPHEEFEHDPHEEYKEYFSWLTPEQGAELKALRDAHKHDETYAKTLDFLEGLQGDKKTEATEKLKGACKHYFKKAFGDEAVEEVKALKESGASMDVIGQKVSDFIDKITDEKKKAIANRVSVNCKKVYSASRRRRSDPSEEYKEYFSWLTPEQGAEWKKARDAGDEEGAYKKVEAIYDALTGEAKAEATQKLKGACKHFFNKEFTADQVEELKNLKEAGTPLDEINTKVGEFLSKITDEKKRAKATRIAGNCKKVFSASRRRREHKHSVDEAMTEFLPWLSDEQKAEIKGLKESGEDAKIGEKIMEFFDSVDASKKDEARTKLQAGCRHYLKHLIGDAAAEEMKALKETGATAGDMATQLEKIISNMPDGENKKKAEGMAKNCKKVYGVAARKRRHEHTLEEGFTEFLPWLTDAQKAELKALKESGGEAKLGEKVLEFFETVDASKKDEARTKLQAGCKHYIKHLIGDEKAAEMKALSDAGTPAADMAAKLEGIITALPDGADKTKAQRLTKNCKKVFGVASRKRRHEHTLEEGFTEFLPWTTEEQKMELKNMKEAGSDKMGEKILEYFDALDGAKKDEARSKLQAGCRHYIKSLIGDAASAEMKALHEAGTTPADMAVKLEEIIGKMAEGEDKTKAMRMSKNCRKVYGVARMRRHEHTMEEGFTEFLPWITEEQKMELKNMKEAGAADKIGDKVIEYYESVDASKKDEARTKLQAGCRHYLKHLLGDTVSGEMKTMHESGASPSEMAKKLEEIIDKMEDGEKKTKAKGLSKNCRKVYGVDARKRRNIYGEYDERYQQYYNWLAEDQKEELEGLKDSGEDDALLDKVSQYFKDLSDAKKEEARGQLKMGCRMRMRDLLGEEKAEEIRRMKDEGASKGEMMDKVAQFVEEMGEGEDKESARRSYKHCAKILGRQRRDGKEGGSLADYTRWLTADQKQELNAIIRSDTISSDDIYSKLFEFLEGLSGEEKKEATMQMRGACRLFRAQFLGPDQSRKLTIMRETGKKWQDIEHTLDAMIAAIEDQSKRRKAQAAMNACKSLYKSLFDQ